MDIAQFNLIRPLSSPKTDTVLNLTAERTIVPHLDPAFETSYGRPKNADEGVVLSVDTIPDNVGTGFDDPLRTEGSLPGDSPLQSTYVLLNRLDEWLATRHDRVAGEELMDIVGEMLKKLDPDMPWATGVLADADRSALFQIALLGIRRWLLDAMETGTRFEGAERLTRLALISDLFNRSTAERHALTDDLIYDMLHRRPVVIEGLVPRKGAKINLIREAKVADLQVVRREWATFIPSEIANIRNLMVGESFVQTDKTLSETETTSTTDATQSTQTIQETQTKLNSELSQQVNTQLGVTVNGHFDASATFSYPMITATVSAGIDASVSIQRSEAHASKLAREAVNRAVSQVDSMTRESRTRRELMRTEQGFEYSLKNDTGANVHAVYRWVDRIDNYQVFRYPDRFLLEFQIPEPAEYYRWRTTRQANAASKVDLPPEWTLTKDQILEEKLIELSVKYRATNLPAAPDPSISIAATLVAAVGPESLPTNESTTIYNLPAASKDLEIPIPSAYVATKVFYSGEGFPIRGAWKTNGNQNYHEGYHAAIASVMVGQHSTIYWNGGIDTGPGNSKMFMATHGNDQDLGKVQTIQWNSPEPPYGRALLPIGVDDGLLPNPVEVNLQDGGLAGVANSLKLGVSTIGVASCALAFMVKCDRTPQAYAEWQMAVYDALYSAWAQWKREYANNQTRQQLLGSSASDAGTSQRNDQVIREELKREVIGWLLGQTSFSGRPGLLPRPTVTTGTVVTETSFGDIDVGQAIIDAPTIQFMEQAFEWTNMTYVFYPYFWADRAASWDALTQITANDPEFERFLRAGSSRVIVPARPGFETAVQNWLQYEIPFLSGQLPAPDDPLYVSIDKEIREITSPWEGGIAGDSWQSRMSTTLLYLETEGDLPFANSEGQLPAPVGTSFKPKVY